MNIQEIQRAGNLLSKVGTSMGSKNVVPPRSTASVMLAVLAWVLAGPFLRAQEPPPEEILAVPQEIDVDTSRPDLASAQSSAGEIFAVWVGDGGLVASVVGPDLKVKSLGKIGEGIVNPSVAVDGNGTAWVSGYRVADGKVVLKSLSSPFGEWTVVQMDENLKIDDPMPLLGFQGAVPYLVTSVFDGSKRRLICLVGDVASGAFSPVSLEGKNREQSFTSLHLYLNVRRPVLAMTPSGVNRLLYAVGGGHAYLCSIDSGDIQPLRGDGEGAPGFINRGDVTTGGSMDEKTGAVAFINPHRMLILADAEGMMLEKAEINIPFNHGGVGPNRRTFANSPDGKHAVFFGGFHAENYAIAAAARKVDGEWGLWTEPVEAALIMPRAHFHEPSGKFVILSLGGAGLLVQTLPTVGGSLESLN